MTRQIATGPFSCPLPAASSDEGPTDGDLLARWAAGSDASALDILVRRHGAMVFGVCRRLVGNVPDAEDAFQATFLILVRKGATLNRPRQVAGWLHGVAVRVSLRVRADLARRRRKEVAMSTDPQVPVPPEDQTDVRRILDEELDKLPDKYRLPIVLCELEGLTLNQAARRLGWPKGTVAGRLSRGREILRRRLSRRSLAFAPFMMVAGPGFPAADGTTGEVPDRLVAAMVALAGNPGSPHGQAAMAIADAVARETASRKGLVYLIAILIAFLIAAGVKTLASTDEAMSIGSENAGGACHSPSP
jgi:RNA polymerase sigma factor (sigma-70 family)